MGQKKGDTIGDLNDTFAFSSFFPEQLAPIVDPIANKIYNIFNMCGVFKWLGSSPPTSANQKSTMNSIDAERRRKRAAIALEKKLSESLGDVQPVSTNSPEDAV